MASSSLILSFFCALSLLAAGALARPGAHFHPCKTLFISYTFTSSETFDLPQVVGPRDASPSSSSGYLAFYRAFRTLHPLSSSAAFELPIRGFRPMIVERPSPAETVQVEPSFGISSLQLRAKDILFVVAGLLFGVVCGALTGAIMYLVWSLFTNQFEIDRSADGDTEDEDEKPNKMGYIKISNQVSEKEGYEGH